MEGHVETLRGDGYVHCIYCGDSFISVYICQHLLNSNKFCTLNV